MVLLDGFKNGLWSLDIDNTLTISGGDSFGVIGQAGDTPLLGDWNGDSKTTQTACRVALPAVVSGTRIV
jgi:hypothetical protein